MSVAAEGAELSADGRLAVVFDAAGARLIDVDSGDVRQAFDRPGTLAATISRDRTLVATVMQPRRFASGTHGPELAY